MKYRLFPRAQIHLQKSPGEDRWFMAVSKISMKVKKNEENYYLRCSPCRISA